MEVDDANSNSSESGTGKNCFYKNYEEFSLLVNFPTAKDVVAHLQRTKLLGQRSWVRIRLS